MGAYEGLSRYFPNGIINKANELGYGEFLVSILKGDIETLEQKYNSLWNVIKSCKYRMDRRTPIEYSRDVVSSWMFEDCVIGALKNSGLNISYGKDYPYRKRFTSKPKKMDNDVIISTPTKSFSLCITCDYTGAWTSTGQMVLRESQYKNLKNKKMLLMGLSTVDNKLVLLNHESLVNVSYVESHSPYGGKSVYMVTIPESSIQPSTIPDMANEIKNYCLYK